MDQTKKDVVLAQNLVVVLIIHLQQKDQITRDAAVNSLNLDAVLMI